MIKISITHNSNKFFSGELFNINILTSPTVNVKKLTREKLVKIVCYIASIHFCLYSIEHTKILRLEGFYIQTIPFQTIVFYTYDVV